MTRVDVKPELFRWARERSGETVATLAAKVHAKYPDWESGKAKPTLKQLEKVAARTRTGLGYFFLERPPEDKVPIPDFRTGGGRQVARPSVDLLDTIYLCQLRQDWYRDHALSNGMQALPFVGSATLSDDAVQVGKKIRRKLGLGMRRGKSRRAWEHALGDLAKKAEGIGVMVMVSGIVNYNTRRKLEQNEFKGFALVDDLAPLVFVNGADCKAAQMFTLAHELANIWLGKSALSSPGMDNDSYKKGRREEIWCNKVAAEVLMPLQELSLDLPNKKLSPNDDLPGIIEGIARKHMVSYLVVLRRLCDVGFLSQAQFTTEYGRAMEQFKSVSSNESQVRFFNITSRLRKTGRLFAKALVDDTVAGHTLYRDAFYLLGTFNINTFHKIAEEL